MNTNESIYLTQDLFQIIKQLSNLKLVRSSFKGMKRSEYELLGILYNNLGEDNKPLAVTELSNLLQITPSGITHLINPLEDKGYIQRLEDSNDRRVVLIGLTDLGRETAKLLIAEIHKKLKGLVNHLGEEDSSTLIRLMSLVIGYLNAQAKTSK